MSNTNSQIISFLRFPLTFLVVAIHSRGEIGQVPDLMHLTTRNLYDMVKVLGSDVIAQVAVPSFFFISGYLFFANVSKLDWATYKNKLGKRVHSLLIPFILWNLICIPLTLMVRYGESLSGTSAADAAQTYWDGIRWLHIFWNATSHDSLFANLFGMNFLMAHPILGFFWYVRDLIVVTLFTPAIFWFFKYTGKVGAVIVLLLLLLNIWPYMTPRISCLYYVLGAYWSMSGHNLYIEHAAIRRCNYLLTLVLGIYLVCVFSYESYWGWQLIHLFTVSGMATTFCLAHQILQKRPSFRFPKLLGESSFFVYALHIEFSLPLGFFIVKALFLHTQQPLLLILQYLLTPVVIYAISLAVYVAAKRVAPRTLSLLTGNR